MRPGSFVQTADVCRAVWAPWASPPEANLRTPPGPDNPQHSSPVGASTASCARNWATCSHTPGKKTPGLLRLLTSLYTPKACNHSYEASRRPAENLRDDYSHRSCPGYVFLLRLWLTRRDCSVPRQANSSARLPTTPPPLVPLTESCKNIGSKWVRYNHKIIIAAWQNVTSHAGLQTWEPSTPCSAIMMMLGLPGGIRDDRRPWATTCCFGPVL
jgi:hypothetical protein